MSTVLVYLFATWGVSVLVSVLLARALRRADAEAGVQEEG
ncbi:hypothetical protein Lokhon_03035 [Limimaricola hongkongensis DSM 17492]|uniref:Uncharacterized protein n=1 Tax=Limimaricola hongkongensis DSM 17492 TaxID=1122180 RepID=A0A017HA59_9RHOB|nr:hypothetical protein Lokhon_03035 [Limimaricola hongkongensis DSM 17492]